MTSLIDLVHDEIRDTRRCVTDALAEELAPVCASAARIGANTQEYFLATRQREELKRAGCGAYAKNLRWVMWMSNATLVVAPGLLAYQPDQKKAVLATAIVGGYEYLRHSVRRKPQY